MNNLGESLFLGRECETALISSALREGKNLVVTGRFGIGRTTLLRRLAQDLKPDFRFLFFDGSKTAGRICEALFLKLFPDREFILETSRSPWRSSRYDLAHRKLPDLRPHVLVLDDIAKLTRQRLDFIRWLRSQNKFQIIAVTERFLPEQVLWQLRTALAPAPLVPLDALTLTMSEHFFEAWSNWHRLGWRPEEIHGMAVATHGYPLNMQEVAQTALKRKGDHAAL